MHRMETKGIFGTTVGLRFINRRKKRNANHCDLHFSFLKIIPITLGLYYNRGNNKKWEDVLVEDCFICNKHAGKIKTAGLTIYEDEFVYVGHIDRNGEPNYLGHIMIDLKRHVPTLGDMNQEEARSFGLMMARVSKALMESEHAEHIYSYVLGDAVPHLHMHLVPRYPNTPKEYWGPNAVYDWPQAPMGTDSEVVDLCTRMKKYLENAYE